MKIKVNAERLVMARYEKGLTVTELAKMTALSRVTVIGAESSNTNTSPAVLKKICNALELSISEVISIAEKAS